MPLEAAYQLKVDIDLCNGGCHLPYVGQHNGASIIEPSRPPVDANQKVYRIKPFSDGNLSIVERRSLHAGSRSATQPILRMMEPVLIACACVTIAALAAAFVGWQRDRMM